MSVTVDVEGTTKCPANTVDNVVNTDQIVRVGKRPNGGSYIVTEDGNSFEVIDKYEEVVGVLLAADRKNGDA